MNHDEIRAALAAATPGPWAWLYPDQCCRDGYCIKSKADLDTCDGVTHAMKALHADVVLIANAPTWLAELLAEVDRLTRWKTEMITVLHGLQDLGKVLGLPLGEQITGETAAEAAHALRARAEAAEQAVQRVRELHTPEVAYDSEHHDCEPSECDRAGEGKPYERCAHCSGFAWEQLWPCSTISALDGGES